MDSTIIGAVLLVIVIVLAAQTIKIVPQQHAWVLERLGCYHRTLTPGLSFAFPFVDRIAYKHILKEIPLEVPSQVCITRDNTQLQVDGVLYFQVTDPMKASYGSSNFVFAITQLSQTTLRSVIGKPELDKTFEERDFINHSIVSSLDEAAANWGVKVLRYEIKDLDTAEGNPSRDAGANYRRARKARADCSVRKGASRSRSTSRPAAREAAIQKSEGECREAINQAQGQAGGDSAVAGGLIRKPSRRSPLGFSRMAAWRR